MLPYALTCVLASCHNAVVTQRYETDLAAALSGLNQLIASREELEGEIARQKRKVAALRELVGAEAGWEAAKLAHGLTDACRTVLRAAGRPLLPVEVKEGVERLGVSPQENLLASVYTVLRRLKLANQVIEVEAHRNPGGSAVMGYSWAGPMQTLGYTVLPGNRKK